MEESRPKFGKFNPLEKLRPQEEMLEVARQKSSLAIGVPREVSVEENRVPLVPDGVALLTRHGHQVTVGAGAGVAAHFSDHEYSEAGAIIAESPREVFRSDIILKVAPVTKEESEWLRPKQTVISALQIAMQCEDYFRTLISRKVTALAYEMIRDRAGILSVIRSMSEIAGSTSVFVAADYLSDQQYGRGKMFGGFTGIRPSEIVILGAGTVGEFAARSALGLGALVKVFDNSVFRLRRIQANLSQRIFTSILHPKVLYESMLTADVIIGAVHSSEGRTPCLVTEDMIRQMKEGSVLIDVSIDQGGCFETSRPTSHKDPVFKVHGVTHYCVPNIPSRVPHTASQALNNIFVPVILDAGQEGGIENLLRIDPGVRNGVYIFNGVVSSLPISRRFNLPFQDLELLMAAWR